MRGHGGRCRRSWARICRRRSSRWLRPSTVLCDEGVGVGDKSKNASKHVHPVDLLFEDLGVVGQDTAVPLNDRLSAGEEAGCARVIAETLPVLVDLFDVGLGEIVDGREAFDPAGFNARVSRLFRRGGRGLTEVAADGCDLGLLHCKTTSEVSI